MSLKALLNYVIRSILSSLRSIYETAWWAVDRVTIEKTKPIIIKRTQTADAQTDVERFWSEHTVGFAPITTDIRFRNTRQSKKHISWRFKNYPLFKEFMQLDSNYDGKVILDYGCGPGNDLVVFSLFCHPKKVVGVDVSMKALEVAKQRLELHGVDQHRVELIKIPESDPRTPLPDDSVDHINCGGVIHHTSNPSGILTEFYRILKTGGSANVMAYNYDSIWLHLYVAYYLQILEGKFRGLDITAAFSKSTDGEDCPVARCYRPRDFISMCETAGLGANYVGGYFVTLELELLQLYRDKALNEPMLGDEHKSFLRRLQYDERGYPTIAGKHIGMGGAYHLSKFAS